jgi:hypothetical protein
VLAGVAEVDVESVLALGHRARLRAWRPWLPRVRRGSAGGWGTPPHTPIHMTRRYPIPGAEGDADCRPAPGTRRGLR